MLYHQRSVSRRCPSCATSFEDTVFYCGYDGTITIQEQDPSDVDRRLGKQLGEYLVVARVADGAMGRVYEGRHPETRERKAIKVLHADVAKDEVAVERFKREYETAEEFSHPHIVDVHEFGQTPDDSWFLTMEYLEGEELSVTLERSGRLPLPRVLRIAAQCALALEYAHSFGVIHRDLKPGNVFVCAGADGDVVRVLDFGSVKLQMETGPKLTAFGTTLGSPYYMSPEQAMGQFDVDQRTDVYALAAIVYEMLCGRVPIEGRSVAQILMHLVKDPPPRLPAPEVPDSVVDVIMGALAKDKKERPPGAGALVRDMLVAAGLDGDVARWASAPLSELEAAIVDATPRPSAVSVPVLPTGAPVVDPVPPAQRETWVTGPRIEAPASFKPRGAALFLVVAVAAAVAFVTVLVAFAIMT